MKNDYGIRVKGADEPFETFAIPAEAKIALDRVAASMGQPVDGTYEIVERKVENIYELFPDNKVYITGVRELWVAYGGE